MPRPSCFKMVRWVAVAILVASLAMLGCSGGVKQAVETVKKAAESAGEHIATINRPDKGHIDVNHNPPIKTDRVFGTFNVFPNAPSVLVIRSYESEVDVADDDSRTSSYPMVFVRAKTSSKSISELVGKKIPAHISVQYAGGFPAWSSEGGRPLEIEVIEGNEYYVKAKFTGASLPEVGGVRRLSCNGTLTALFPAAAKKAEAPAPAAEPESDND